MDAEILIQKFKQKHGDRYDYSKVVSARERDSVIVICPKHGEFSIMARSHIGGMVCPECRREQLKREFIEKADILHNHKYDYSRVQYKDNKTRVEIICPEHGPFMQTPSRHLHSAGCTKCGRQQMHETMLEQYGSAHALQCRQFKEKAKNTCLDHYGKDNPAKVPEIQARIRETNRGRYGCDHVLSSPDVRAKIEQTNLDVYGSISPLGNKQVREKGQETLMDTLGVDNAMKSPEVQRKVAESVFQNYEVGNAAQSKEIYEKIRQTNLKRYGAAHPMQNPEIYKKHLQTKFKNGTSGPTSAAEERMAVRLVKIFGKDDVARHGCRDEYPYQCDFYISSRDLYIELNGCEHHHGRWYEGTEEDLYEVERMRSRQAGHPRYAKMIQTWTVLDVRKRETARKNHLNYLTFWRCDLKDFEEWVDAGMPDGCDWKCMYSWKNY